MPSLVPTLAALVSQADRVTAEGRIPAARRAWEDLVQRAQEKRDRPTEVVARSMLARCLLRMQQRDEARHEVALAERIADPTHTPAYGRFRAAHARLALEEGPPAAARRALQEYLAWAEDERQVEAMLDAATLLGAVLDPDERAVALGRTIELARIVDPGADVAAVCVDWASALDALGRAEAALEAWTEALRGHRERGRARPAVAAGWGAGAAAVRLEDWPLARTLLEEAVRGAEQAAACDDLAALALADLALVHEAAGDDVEARHLLIRALRHGRSHHLASAWPERWAALLEQAARLEVD
jgi:tetratricopeptide (TPR) repeat protein